jgi:predicted Zn finger-like uncharacterized protein
MAKEVLCPICGATYNLADEQLGKKVRCKKCEHPFTAGGEPKRREDDDYDDEDDGGIQDAPRGRARAKSGARSERGRDRGRDRDDDRPKKTKSLEEQAKPRGESQPGLPVSSFVIMGVVLGVLFLCCGGAGLVYWMWPRHNAPAPKPAPPGRRADANPPADQPPPNIPQPPNFPQPPPDFPPLDGFGPGRPSAVANLKEALEAVRDNDRGKRQAGADWLARATRDEGQAAEVSKALDVLVRDAQPDMLGGDRVRAAALAALKTWGTKENVPTLVDFLQTQRARDPHWIHIMGELKDAMAALGRIGDERGVDAVVAFTDTIHGIHLGNAHEEPLRQMGSVAEKVGLQRLKEPDRAARLRAWTILAVVGTRTNLAAMEAAAAAEADRDVRAKATDAIRSVKLRAK